MTSVLESDYIKPTRPYSSNELSDMRNNFFNNNVGNCSCCWKLSKTPNNLLQKAEDLVNIYSTKFNEYPSFFTYDLIDIEICFYKWLYVDKYDYEYSENKNFKKNNQRKNLKVNTNI